MLRLIQIVMMGFALVLWTLFLWKTSTVLAMATTSRGRAQVLNRSKHLESAAFFEQELECLPLARVIEISGSILREAGLHVVFGHFRLWRSHLIP
jgi:hypothetical protein